MADSVVLLIAAALFAGWLVALDLTAELDKEEAA